MTRSIAPAVTVAYLMLCVLLGGSSVAYSGNLLLQLLGIFILYYALAANRSAEITAAGRELIVLILLLLLLIAVQLVPLPPLLWTMLPGRGSSAEAYDLVRQPQPWLPISLAPYRTVTSSVWLLPPIAILVTCLRLNACRAAWIACGLIGVTMAAVMLGTLQIVGGPGWYPYEITDEGTMTGFFANPNHLATLLLATMPFAAALYTRARRNLEADGNQAAILILTGLAGIFILVGLVVSNSLAALALSVPVAGASLLMIRSERRRVPGWWWAALAAAGAASTATILMGPFDNDLLVAESQIQQTARSGAWPRTLQAAVDFAPFGSGVGTFVDIYPRYEDPTLVDTTYMNHAHNDYLEIALETGLPGLALLGAFSWWWGRRTASLWRSSRNGDIFGRAATIASAAILMHSAVDYPLRMAAISTLLALCCGLMSIPLPQASPAPEIRRRSPKPLHLAAE